jgi:hypothetical protein
MTIGETFSELERRTIARVMSARFIDVELIDGIEYHLKVLKNEEKTLGAIERKCYEEFIKGK